MKWLHSNHNMETFHTSWGIKNMPAAQKTFMLCWRLKRPSWRSIILITAAGIDSLSKGYFCLNFIRGKCSTYPMQGFVRIHISHLLSIGRTLYILDVYSVRVTFNIPLTLLNMTELSLFEGFIKRFQLSPLKAYLDFRGMLLPRFGYFTATSDAFRGMWNTHNIRIGL